MNKMAHVYIVSVVAEALISTRTEETRIENICKNQNYPQSRHPTRNSNQKTGASFSVRNDGQKGKGNEH